MEVVLVVERGREIMIRAIERCTLATNDQLLSVNFLINNLSN